MSFISCVMNLDLPLRALDNAHRRAVLTAMRDPRKNFPPIDGVDPQEHGVCVAQISEFLGVNQSTASTYMRLLYDADLVSTERVGRYTRYKRNEKTISAVAAAITNQL
ncbi:ArsR/SmtB family transcription factor [Hirschia litorea]|uniref:ArsR/SmtB family transcription factor n=1 Tax=Hirschia litorea TaxID=1199156 RepID=A0ABW2IHF2_9PROT